ncbi:SlyX family protein [Pseudomonas sp. LRF_L74]|uniref:SlyX family protein n=1 Tax=Pseudomonas sp. LRF_L74 TaxID=3369422 RepID=UPI003F5EBDD7
MTLEDRLVELETRQAFQDDTIAALNDALVEQQRLIERLQLQVLALTRRQEEMQVALPNSDNEPPPPHY